MSKNSRFSQPFDKQQRKCAQARFKSASQHLNDIHWSMLRQLSCKKSLFVISQILSLLVNTLPAIEKYPALTRDNLTIPIQMQLSQKQKTFSQFFAAFLKSSLNFKHFEKKMTLIAFVFWKLLTPKTWLDKCLKSPVSEDPSKSYMVNVHKHCWNLPHRPFILLIYHW